MSYHVVPGAEFQCKLPMSGALAALHSGGRKLSTIDEQDHDEANRRGKINQVTAKLTWRLIHFFCLLVSCKLLKAFAP